MKAKKFTGQEMQEMRKHLTNMFEWIADRWSLWSEDQSVHEAARWYKDTFGVSPFDQDDQE